MRGIMLVCLACAALLPMTVAEAELTAADAPCGKEAWNRFVPDLVAAQSAFVRGDPASMKALWSHAEDVTLMGPGEAASVGGRWLARDSTGFRRAMPEEKECTPTTRSPRSLDQIWRSSSKSSTSRLEISIEVQRNISA